LFEAERALAPRGFRRRKKERVVKARHQARRQALQILYQLDVNGQTTATTALYHFERHFAEHVESSGVGTVDPFATELVLGVVKHQAAIDREIDRFSAAWKLVRMPAVDRNILRLGVFELRHRKDIPATVTIDEMVELAKEFGSENTPAFVNGVLDRVRQEGLPDGKAP
jgi:N utilization substance protein B